MIYVDVSVETRRSRNGRESRYTHLFIGRYKRTKEWKFFFLEREREREVDMYVYINHLSILHALDIQECISKITMEWCDCMIELFSFSLHIRICIDYYEYV
jgi:hypothetical protein